VSAGRADRAEQLRSLHRPGDPLVLVNVWDAASARVVAGTPGVRAIATASWAISAALGAPDGEGLSRDAMLAAVARIVAAVDLPVSADLERGYGLSPDEVAVTLAEAIRAGAVGANIEDSQPDGSLRNVGEQEARLRAARAAAQDVGVPVVLNARTDTVLLGGSLEEAIDRGRGYLAAGADCIFVPGVQARADVESLVSGLGMVSVLATPAHPPLRELAAAGVCRVSVGPGAMGVAYAALARAAEQLMSGGTYPPDLSYRPR
jgi:2-methylisocitrate lyase-like PEP mutase family enzyme